MRNRRIRAGNGNGRRLMVQFRGTRVATVATRHMVAFYRLVR